MVAVIPALHLPYNLSALDPRNRVRGSLQHLRATLRPSLRSLLLTPAESHDEACVTRPIPDAKTYALSSFSFRCILTSTLTTSYRRQLFALIIGIDVYKSDTVIDLQGAVADANAFADFLRTYSHQHSIKPSITLLTNENATRTAIVDGLQDLRLKPAINHGDAIVIYYAGHGSSAPAPMQWRSTVPDDRSNERMEFIVPHDCDAITVGIPDRTLAACLDLLANSKGDNIVSPRSRRTPSYAFFRVLTYAADRYFRLLSLRFWYSLHRK